MTLYEEVAWLRKELRFERGRVRAARDLAIKLAESMLEIDPDHPALSTLDATLRTWERDPCGERKLRCGGP